MSIWKEILSEKKMTSAEIRKAGEAALKSEQKKNKEERKKKEKSAYTKYLQQQLEFKKQKYEEQKKKQLENIKKIRVERHKEGIKSALGGVKTDTISSKDPEGTTYAKAAGTVASLAGGVAKAAVHGVGYLGAKRKAKQEAKIAKEKQIEKKEPGKQGRPRRKSQEQSTQRATTSEPVSTQNQLPPGTKPEPVSTQNQLPPGTKPEPVSTQNQLPPGTKKLPPAGETSFRRRLKAKTLRQRVRRNPKIKAGLIRQSMGEGYSNWREELLVEQGLIIEVDSEKTKLERKKIDVMKGKNKIEINPTVSEDHKEISSGKKKDDEGYMASSELDTMERAIKQLRKKVKKSDVQLPAWVQSKITKAADYIDTAADYMASDAGLDEAYDDETFRQHSRETFSSYVPSQSSKRTSNVLKKIKELNISTGKKKKKKKSKVDESMIDEDWQKVNREDDTPGLSQKAVDAYRRENPGSKLQTAVTEKNPTGERAGRRKRFCSRMSGMKDKLTSAKTARDPDSDINKALRRWNCG